ncbi:O-antigen ligase family protein [uncultured Oxalicibacterium sp.]|uniref:O-antigen ligase family protein n=1 Tax=uncultured Oxalicibacterium sp. TaxID=1168540 RepID=UPI0025F88F9F|nr:O-antigen ligase family protein [uncultured Oxalicibacterium sp.]
MTEIQSIDAREKRAQFILSLLPFTLFFPVGITNFGVVLFAVAVLLAGNHAQRWQRVKNHPLFFPILGLLAVCCLEGAILPRSHDFWKAFLHYQIYLFFLLFISVGAGAWQRHALNMLFVGAGYAATLFYIHHLHPLPDWSIFQNYILYAGNKSILIGMMLGVAGGLLFNDLIEQKQGRWWRIFLLVYIAIALFLFAKTRTGSVMFFLVCGVVFLRHLRFSWRTGVVAVALLMAAVLIWQTADGFRERMLGTYHDLKAFSQGGTVSSEGVRLEMYRITLDMIRENPVMGGGIGTWGEQYPTRAQGLLSENMATPHNDYLLYTAEIGLLGVATLLTIWLTQLWIGMRMYGADGTRVLAITVALMFGGAVNAILRDALFGMAFMILLAIPLAGVSRHRRTSSTGDQ